jgi:hypothetical protein
MKKVCYTQEAAKEVPVMSRKAYVSPRVTRVAGVLQQAFGQTCAPGGTNVGGLCSRGGNADGGTCAHGPSADQGTCSRGILAFGGSCANGPLAIGGSCAVGRRA